MNTNNSRIEIEDLAEKNGIEDTNLMIVEDSEDTKKTTVYEMKKAFSGDNFVPAENKFYSSKKIEEINDDIKREMANKASEKELEAIKKKVNDITASAGSGKDSELVAARDGKSSLSERLDFDSEINDSKYMSKVKRVITGKVVDIPDHYGYVDITIVSGTKESAKAANNLTVSSKNIIDPGKITEVANQISRQPDTYGFKYTQKTSGATFVEIPMPMIYPAGSYYFFSHIEFDNSFKDKNIKFNITYSDGTIDSLPYTHTETYKFDAKKGFNKISLAYNLDQVVDAAYVIFQNVMITHEGLLPNKYVPYERYVFNMAIGDNKFEFMNKNYIYECNIQNANVAVEYYDNDITADSIVSDIKYIKDTIGNSIDKCGLITDYGTYQFLDNAFISDYEEGIIVQDGEEEFNRNGVSSKKITISESATRNSTIRIPLDKPIRVIENTGILFFMNKPDFSTFTDITGGVRIRMCSDDIRYSTETNYYEYLISKKEMVQGWNFVKRRMTEFKAIGNPNPNNIQYISLQIVRTDELNGKSLYVNSIVFNQKMKPTVLLCFNGTYDESITYLYPYLKTRGIKPTIFLNAKRTLTPDAVDEILKYKVLYNWDIGTDGCHPNKEILTQDDNFRNQYIALKNSREWLKDLMVNNPVSYSAPYGNLRPITVPLLEDLGYKIAKTQADTWCGFFSEKDFCMPMYLLSNTTDIESVLHKIEYAIESNQTICLYTNDVTEYGSDIDSKKIMLESVIDYIQEKVNTGDLQCLTFKEFYTKCTK